MGDLRFPVRIDAEVLKEDLGRATQAARTALSQAVRRIEDGGVAVTDLRPCEAEARDGTRLGGCVKHYIPQPDGKWGAVFSIDYGAIGPALLLLAVGERHPDRPWKPSVYEIAHRRLHR